MRNVFFLCFLFLFSGLSAQDIEVDTLRGQSRDGVSQPLTVEVRHQEAVDSIVDGELADSMQTPAAGKSGLQPARAIEQRSQVVSADTLKVPAQPLTKERWIPDPKRALWLAIVFPGGGQIYNRKYWKLPIFYGGFVGCFYAISWNNTMYRDYTQAFLDIMDDDPQSKSYENFLPPSYDVDANLERLQDLFKRRKNYYRRYRDLSIFCMIGVYALSIVDAYVDAELSSFDISKDLSLKVRPSIINDRSSVAHVLPSAGNSYGLQCALSF